MSDDALTGDRRCWPCTAANAAVGLLVGWTPLAAAFVRDDPTLLVATLAWGVAVSLFTVSRLRRLGYLPYAEPVARHTRLHHLVGPGAESDDEERE